MSQNDTDTAISAIIVFSLAVLGYLVVLFACTTGLKYVLSQFGVYQSFWTCLVIWLLAGALVSFAKPSKKKSE